MSKREEQTLSVAAQRDLDTIDTALNGETMTDERSPLAELALALSALRPQPTAEFAASLDERAAYGFERGRRPRSSRQASSVRSRWSGRGTARSIFGHPAFALAALAAVAVAVAAPLALLRGGAVRHSGAVQHSSLPAPRSAQTPQVAGAGAAAGASPTGKAGAKAPAAGAEAPAAGAEAPAAGAEAPANSSAPSFGGAGELASEAAAPGARLLERGVTLDIGLAQSSIESTSRQVFTLASAFHGYVQQSNVSSGETEQGAGATFQLRLPSANLTGAIAALAHLGRVRSENDTTNDVTSQFNSLRRSLQDAEAERSGVLKQLTSASEQRRAEALKARLRALEARISQRRSALGALAGRIDYTTVALSLTPEASRSGSAGVLTPGGAASDAAAVLTAALAVVLLASAALLPLAAVVMLAWILLTIMRRHLREQALGRH
jgi:hypothetical protein